jgi:hypothetical protein
MLTVIYDECRIFYCYTECCYAEYHFAECSGADTKCCFAECRNGEYRIITVIMSVVMLSVMAPLNEV